MTHRNDGEAPRIENAPDQLVGGGILTAVYERLGIRIEFAAAPTKRALIESSQGRLDGEVQRVLDVESEYPTLLPVREAINYIEPSAFTARSDITVDGWASIARYDVGIVRGVGSSERGTRGMPHVEAATTMDQLMEMAASARVDIAVNDRFSGLLVTRRLGLDQKLRPLTLPLQHIELCVVAVSADAMRRHRAELAGVPIPDFEPGEMRPATRPTGGGPA